MDISNFFDSITFQMVLSRAFPSQYFPKPVGVLLAIFQAVTQIHEQTLGFILKLIVVILVLLVGGGWMMETLLEYTREIFTLMATR